MVGIVTMRHPLTHLNHRIEENFLTEYGAARTYTFSLLRTFKEDCMAFYAEMEEGDVEGDVQYVGFTDVTESDLDEIDDIRRELPKMWFFYDRSEEILIVKFMVGVTHELSGRLLGYELERLINSRTGLRHAILPVGSARFTGFRKAKESDSCFKPTTRHMLTDWPSVVIEVGVSQSLAQLWMDARFWLECSGGQTRVVILISVNRRARSWEIERWQQNPAIGRLQPVRNMGVPNPYARTHVAMQVQSLSMHEGQNYVGPSLIIPVDLVLDVLPPIQGAPWGSNDFEMTAQMLSLLNEDLWNGTM